MQEATERFKEQKKSTDPKQPRAGLLSTGHALCWQDTTFHWGSAAERQPKAPKRTTSLWPAQHSLGRRFPPAPAPGMQGELEESWAASCEPLQPLLRQLPPPSTSIHLLPGHGCPPPPATSHSSQESSRSQCSVGGCSTGVALGKTHTQTRDKRAIRSLENKELVIMKKGQIS